MKTLRLLTLIAIGLFLNNSIEAQEWLWSRHLSTASASTTNGIYLDASDNVYVTGKYKADLSVGDGVVNTIQGNTDMHVTKYDVDGGVLWSTNIYAPAAGKVRPNNPVEDAAGSIYVSFDYDRAIANLGIDVPYSTTRDIGITKLNPTTGAEIVSRRVAWGPGNVTPQHISVNVNDEIFLVGFADDTIYMDGGRVFPSDKGSQVLMATFDQNLNVLTANVISYSSTDVSKNKIVEVVNDKANEIYMCGFFTDSIFFRGDTVVSSSPGVEDMVLMKFYDTDSLSWYRQGGGSLADRYNGLDLDRLGGVYVTGYITGTVTVDSTGKGTRDSSPITSAGGTDMFVANYSSTGDLVWKRINGDAGGDIGYGAYVFENLVQFTGYYSGEVAFNVDTLRSGSTALANTGFFVYDTDGNAITAKDVQGDGNDRADAITYDEKGNTYIAGYVTSTNFSIGDSTYLNPSGTANNGFLAKYRNPFSATMTFVKDADCNNGTEGKLIVTPFFGAGGYTYQWSPNATNTVDSAALDLRAGLYTVTITDLLDSTALTQATITEPTAIGIAFSQTDVSCNMGNDGAIDLTASGGTVASTYTYSWSGGPGLVPTDEDQTGLEATWYKVTVSDDNLCQAVDSVLLTQPDGFTFSGTTLQEVSPPGSSTGIIWLETQGGTGTYTYDWEYGGLSFATTQNISSRPAGPHTVTVTDANLCTGDTTIIIPDAALLQTLPSVTDISCYGGSDGTASVGIINKDPGMTYSYAWADSATATSQGTDTFALNLQPGKYYVTVSEDLGPLFRVAVDSVVISQPDSLYMDFTPTAVTCYGQSDGSVAMSVFGGSPTYTYAWAHGPTTESFGSATAGKYYVTVTDINLCTKTDSVEIIQPDSLWVSFNVANELKCFGDENGNLVANGNGGNGSYTWLWGSPINSTDPLATNLSAGTYTIAVTDAKGCTKESSYELNQPDEFLITVIDTSHVTCKAGSDGRIEIEATGGSGNYTYSWFGSTSNTNVADGLIASPFPYIVTVEEVEQNCGTVSDTFYIREPQVALAVEEILANRTNNLCYGESNAGIELQATGGWGRNEFSIDDVNWQSSGEFSGLPAGIVSAFVRDSLNCKVESEITITDPDSIYFQLQEVVGPDINVVAIGGTGTLTYSINGVDYQTSGLFQDVGRGVYNVLVTDDNQCGPFSSDALEVIVDDLETNHEEFLSLYPNPSNGKFYIELNTNHESDFKIEIIDLTGRKVYEQMHSFYPGQQTPIQINIEGKSKGIYLLKINGKVYSNKLLVE